MGTAAQSGPRAELNTPGGVWGAQGRRTISPALRAQSGKHFQAKFNCKYEPAKIFRFQTCFLTDTPSLNTCSEHRLCLWIWMRPELGQILLIPEFWIVSTQQTMWGRFLKSFVHIGSKALPSSMFDTETPPQGPGSGNFFPLISWVNRINFLMNCMNTKYSNFAWHSTAGSKRSEQ